MTAASAPPLLVVGDATLLPVVHRAMAWHALQGRRLLVVDAEHAFDPHAVYRYARAWEPRPAQVLDRVWIARAFTAYQLLGLAERLWNEGAPAFLWVWLAPLALWAEPDLVREDAPWLFRRFLGALNAFAGEGHRQWCCQPTQFATGPWVRRLAQQFPLATVRQHHIERVSHGQDRAALFLEPGRRSGDIQRVSTGLATGGSGTLRHAMELRTAPRPGRRSASRPRSIPNGAAGNVDRTATSY